MTQRKAPRFEIIDDQMAAVLRRKTDAQRLRSVDAFWKSALEPAR